MDDVLLEIVLRRLGESPLAEQPTNLLLAALDAEENLSDQLGGQAAPRPSGVRAGTPLSEPAGAYLQSITVTGFRGIGEPATLSLTPGPGLTLVVGRNGSGKSSFAEALEVLLTGELRRWEKLSAVWRQGWRSMHHPERAEITAEFLVEGAGRAVVQRTWPAGTDFTGSSVSVQYAGEKRTGLDRLGWSEALAEYRPFLSHSELEAFFGSPSGLYELLASVLGLEDLTLAAARLAQARLARESALRDVKKRLPDLLGIMEDTDDERAAACRDALSGRTWDLAAARRPRPVPRWRPTETSSTGSAASRSSPLPPSTMSARPPRRSGRPRSVWTLSPARPLAGRGRWPGCSPRRSSTTTCTATETVRCAAGRER
jgi:energy-coupling factor transporter ATP-binding protein EcfA2